jgi:hypothetical protein
LKQLFSNLFLLQTNKQKNVKKNKKIKEHKEIKIKSLLNFSSSTNQINKKVHTCIFCHVATNDTNLHL